MSGFTGFPNKGPRSTLSRDEALSIANAIVQSVESVEGTLNWVLSGLSASKPTAGFANRLYIGTDATKTLWLDDGSSWIQIV